MSNISHSDVKFDQELKYVTSIEIGPRSNELQPKNLFLNITILRNFPIKRAYNVLNTFVRSRCLELICRQCGTTKNHAKVKQNPPDATGDQRSSGKFGLGSHLLCDEGVLNSKCDKFVQFTCLSFWLVAKWKLFFAKICRYNF